MPERLPPENPTFTQEARTEEPFKYELLTGHERTDGTYKTDEQLRMEYIELTDSLVYQMTHGVEVVDPITHEKQVRKPDYVVWLDKSARPLAWLTKELWNKLAPEPGNEDIPEVPKFRFVSVDREQWVNQVDPEGVGAIDMGSIDKNIIRSLRSIFVHPKDKRDGLTESIDEAEAELDGKTVLIVDEVYSTGRTLSIAKQFFQKAFPTANVAGTYWMRGITTKEQAVGNKDLPVWYKQDEIYGRGIGNRSPYRSIKSDNTTQRLGAWFLGTRLPKSDKNALQLRKEFKALAADPEIPIIPSVRRPREQRIARLIRLNGVETQEDAVKKIQAVKGIK